MIDCDEVRLLINLVSNCSIKDHETTKIRALYGNNANNLAASLIQRGLFLENLSLIATISRDSWRIYSYIRNQPENDRFNDLTEGLMSGSLIKLCKTQPMKSYLGLSFRQMMDFIMMRNKSDQLIDMPYLMSYMNELRFIFETLCAEDRLAMKPSSAGCAISNYTNDANLDASFLTSWTLIEGAKYCICLKFAPDMTASEFLNLLQKEISTPVAFGDKIARRFLVNFLQNLDKLIFDRISESSTGKHTFHAHNNIEQFYKANCQIFKSWLLKNRQNIAGLSMKIDDPAECWRNANLKLCSDLATKYQGSSSPNRDASLSQTLMSLNAKNWYSNLSLIASSAKQLEDLSLLYGIKTLTEFGGIICEYPPLNSVLFNLEGKHQETYNLLKDSKNLDQQSLVEFLHACNELNLLEINQAHVEELESEPLKAIYKRYLASKSGTFKLPREDIENWLNTWSDLSEFGQIDQPISSYMDLVVPTCLNMIVRVSDDKDDGRCMKLIERTEWLISQDFISQSLFEPSFVNKNIKIYHVLLDLLRGRSRTIDEKLLEIHAKDLHWNHLLYRHLSDLDLITDLRKDHHVAIDLVQFRAAKYNRRRDNSALASRIAQDLTENATSEEIKFRNSLLLTQNDPKKICKSLLECAKQISYSKDLNQATKNELILKVLRRILRLPEQDIEKNELNLFGVLQVDQNFVVPGGGQSEVTTFERWQHLMESTSLISTCRTLLSLSKRLNDQLQSGPNDDDRLLNHTFSLDLKLLKCLCQQTGLAKHKASGLECGTRILKQIAGSYARLSSDNLNEFKTSNFIDSTMSIWVVLRTNLISIISYKDDIAIDWREALISIIKHIVQLHPNLLIYSIIVNRLDLQNELVYLNNETLDPCSILLQNTALETPHSLGSTQEPSAKFKDCQRKLAYWNELFDHIIQFDNRWHGIVKETEVFVKEIRRISFLCGEYLKTLTVKIPKKLFSFMEHFRKFADTKSGLILNQKRQDECYKRLKTTCEQTMNPIKALSSYSKKIGLTNLNKYDLWFCDTFSKHLRELEYRVNLLSKKKPMILDDMTKLVKSITELLAVCRSILLEYNRANRQKLYMEMISPLLSRLEPSLIPMPDCCNEPTASPKKSFTSIHKISQTINLIVSKTSPKKLKLIGSDGISRSFLLKAHEDLRLDQLIMDLFASINNLFLSNRGTRDKFRLRRYSVTPVSSRSGLIQWIEAPSLCSSYRAWLDGPNGCKLIEELYATSCGAVCEGHQARSRTSHTNCQPPDNNQSTDLFYQLLWAKTKPTKGPLTQTRPFVGNIIKYRAEFDPSVFQSVVEHLITRMPQDLLANQLWYMSNNSHSYWLKTQEFIRSCAAMSIVGYIIGLGDRHPENILLDYGTGEVIHIDYSICFELGKTLPIPEQVPFRLTQNIIHAFGFAGLEGGFTIACRNVLDALKGHRATLLHLLDPINLKFMIGKQAGGKTSDEPKDQTARVDFHELSSESNTLAKLPSTSMTKMLPHMKPPIEMDMCSQESVELKPAPVADVADLLIMNHHRHRHRHPSLVQGQQASTSCNRTSTTTATSTTTTTSARTTNPKSQAYQSFDFQHNIKTPTKILEKTATNIHERFRDKLSGTDECVRHYKIRQDHNGNPVKNQQQQLSDVSGDRMMGSVNVEAQNMVDLIMLNDAQTTEDQVEALIIESTSIKNKAAMFEGWMPWI